VTAVTGILEHKVFVTEQIPQSGRGPMPDGSTRMWSPITSTLIMGRHAAVLVDPPLTARQADEVGDWIAATGRELRQIYITHGHGDHWFGAIPLLKRFPGVTVQATEGTAKLMAAQNDPQFRAEFWDRVFPGQLPAGEVDVTVVDEAGFDLDGVALLPVEVGHTDTDATTMLHVPQTGLLVAGDVVYNGVHLYLTESGGASGIDEWLAALDTAENLHPITVVAGHKVPGASDDASQIHATRRYLTDARRLLESSTHAEDFYDRMLSLHGERLNPGALWGAAITLLAPSTSKQEKS
jgi:glyoxylase-like metal-dependent hydrolase (beta-lactamase superfamily II)